VSAAKDVLHVLNHLKIYPHTLLGHSFGGKGWHLFTTLLCGQNTS
jgi:pimeloyl-ACP methyl ester carboxylesterase